MMESGVDVNTTRVHPYMYIITYKFIASSRRNDANNKCNLRKKPNNLNLTYWTWGMLQPSIHNSVGGQGYWTSFLIQRYYPPSMDARIDAGERKNSVEGTVLNPISYLESGLYFASRESRSLVISALEFHRGVS